MNRQEIQHIEWFSTSSGTPLLALGSLDSLEIYSPEKSNYLKWNPIYSMDLHNSILNHVKWISDGRLFVSTNLQTDLIEKFQQKSKTQVLQQGQNGIKSPELAWEFDGILSDYHPTVLIQQVLKSNISLVYF